MAKTEFKVGEEFDFGLMKLKVEKRTPWDGCCKCVFHNTKLCKYIDKYIGSCFDFKRSDKTDIVFVKMEE